MFVSDKFSEPNDHNSQFAFFNKLKLEINPKKENRPFEKRGDSTQKSAKAAIDKIKFNCEYLYFNFYSIEGCSIKVKPRFPNGKHF